MHDIDSVSIAEIRELTGLKRREFCDIFDLPYRTLQSWELGDTKCSPMIKKLIYYYLLNEGYIREY